MFEELTTYINSISGTEIPEERKQILDQLTDYVKQADQPKLNFICTHNSRRSHLSQIWAQTFADHFSIAIESFSGGTEATAFNPNAVAAIKRAGFKVEQEGDENPKYQVSHSQGKEPMVCYSKRFDETPNPTSGFAAIMTCSEADAECPVVFGADQRIKLFYQDPKASDGTPQEAAIYDERCAQIAAEMHYVFSTVK